MSRKKRLFSNPASLARYLRIRQGLTLQKMSDLCGLSANQICRFEMGRRHIHLVSALKLANFFGVSIDDLAYDRYANVLPTLPALPQRDPAVRRRLVTRQQTCDKAGCSGEAYVARLEREKLAGTLYANGVNEAFADELAAGFDIFSFSRDGRPIYIEVKATTGDDDAFVMSVNEQAFMEFCYRNGHRYELHRVYHVNDPQRIRRAIFTAEELKESFDFAPCEYRVKRKGGHAA